MFITRRVLSSCMQYSAVYLNQLGIACARNKSQAISFRHVFKWPKVKHFKLTGRNQKIFAGTLMALFQAAAIREETEQKNIYLESSRHQVCEKEEQELAISSIAKNADWLNEHRSAEEQYRYVELQNFGHSQDPELLWRFARACYCIYAYSTSATKEAKAAAIKDGLKAVEKAVELDPDNADAFVVTIHTM